jgi:hypothetical protein
MPSLSASTFAMRPDGCVRRTPSTERLMLDFASTRRSVKR